MPQMPLLMLAKAKPTPQIQVSWKKKNFKFKTKDDFFHVFLDWNLKQLISYLKSALPKLSK